MATLMETARKVAMVTNVPYELTLQTLASANGMLTGSANKELLANLEVYRKRQIFRNLQNNKNTVARVAYNLLGSKLEPTEASRFKSAIRLRAKLKPYGDRESTWDAIINGKTVVIPDLPLIMAILFAMIENDVQFAIENDDQFHINQLKTMRAKIAVYMMHHGMFMEPSELLAAIQAIYRKHLTSIGIERELFQAMDELRTRTREVPEPYYVVGLCRGFTTGKGCPAKTGRHACQYEHICLECGSDHGWADCNHLPSLFRSGNGNGYTYDQCTRPQRKIYGNDTKSGTTPPNGYTTNGYAARGKRNRGPRGRR